MYNTSTEICEHPYKKGDKIWMINDRNKPELFIIDQLDPCSVECYFIRELDEWFSGDEFSNSYEDIINKQIEYWMCLKNQKKSTCSADMSMLQSLEHVQQEFMRLQKMWEINAKKAYEIMSNVIDFKEKFINK